MDTTARSLTQTLLTLESDGASGVLTAGEPGSSRTWQLAHGRLVLAVPDELDDDLRGMLYGHGFDARDAGAVRVAVIDRLTGAIAAALADDEPRIAFAPTQPTDGVTVPTSTALRDAKRQLAESERLSIQLPADGAVPDRIHGATSTTHLSRFLGTAYAAVDGSRDLGDLAENLHVDIATVRRAMFRLSVLGLLRFGRSVATMNEPALGMRDADWAGDQLAEAIEEPEPWVGYANADSDVPPPTRRPLPSGASPVQQSEAKEPEPAEPGGATMHPSTSTIPTPPNRQRPLDEGERRESLRQAAAWLADIDHVDEADEPEPDVDADTPNEPAPTTDFSTTAPTEDVSDFLRELSQLSRDDD